MKETRLPFVSVVIPAYNHEEYVREALLSAMNQEHPHLEIVVIDDGSTDATPHVVETVLSMTERPHTFIRQENQGVHAALNAGIKASGGEFIAILNSDDFYHDGRIVKFVAAALDSGSEFLFSKVRHIGANGETLPRSSPFVSSYHDSLNAKELFPTKSFELIRHNYAVTSGNFFFSRRLYDLIGGFKKYKLCHDWDFILKALIHVEPFFIDEALMSYRIHGRNVILVENRDLTGETETEEVLLNYLQLAENPHNGLAPCWKNWGRYWSYFVRKHMEFAFYFEALTPFLL